MSDKMKWAYLCKLGGLFEAGPDAGTWSEAIVAEKTHEQSMRVVLVGTHRPGGLEESLLPDFLPADCRSWGWHDWQDKKVNVCRGTQKGSFSGSGRLGFQYSIHLDANRPGLVTDRG